MLQPVEPLVSVLSNFLKTEEAVICEGTYQMFTDKDTQIQEVVSSWLSGRVISAVSYAVDLLQNSTPVDSLFLSLALAWANIHTGVLHSEGLWLSQVDGSRSVADLLLARTKDGFCRVSCGIVPRKVELQTVPEDHKGWNMLPLS